MSSDNLKIQVKPISEEFISSLADVHCEAFAGYMNSRIGKSYIKAFLRWFCLNESAIALMSVNEKNEPCGYVVGAPLGYDRLMNRELFGAALKGMIVRPWLAFDSQIRRTAAGRMKLLFGQTIANHQAPDLPEPVISLVGIGVSSKARGQGAGKTLMQAFESEAGKHKMAAMRLSVYAHNSAARRLYEKLCWQPFIEPINKDSVMYYSKII